MQLLRLNSLPQSLLPPMALTIGNFDGVHVGHQAMIKQLKVLADKLQLKVMVMLFEPQPLEFLKKEAAPARLSSWREKIEILQKLGVDYVVTARFNEAFRRLSAQQFTELLKQKLNVKALVVGDDFRFGCDRAGDMAFLQKAGFDVEALHTILVDHERVSSTRIRDALAGGDFALAEKLLGRPYSISGRVQYGDQIGRTLDFPTANIALNRPRPPLQGIYAATVQAVNSSAVLNGGLPFESGMLGATHVGTRPAIDQKKPEWRLEVFLPEFNGDLYGKRLNIIFKHYLHGERNYPSLDALKEGIQQDVQDIKEWAQHSA